MSNESIEELLSQNGISLDLEALEGVSGGTVNDRTYEIIVLVLKVKKKMGCTKSELIEYLQPCISNPSTVLADVTLEEMTAIVEENWDKY